MKKLFAVYGNCQSQVLASFLMTCTQFAKEWDCLNIPGLHLMTNDQLANFKSRLPQLSLLIYQNVKRGDRATSQILPLVSSNCIQVSIPSLFFNGYNPEVAYVRQSSSQLFYHDRIMLKHITNFERFRNLLVSEDYFPVSFSKDCVEVSLEDLAIRERKQGLQVTISDFIAENYRQMRLFHVLNHPTAFLLKELASRVLLYLGIKPVLDETVSMGPLVNFQFPVYQSHRQNLQLEFVDEHEYIWAGTPYTLEKFFAKRKIQYDSLDLAFAKKDTFEFRKPVVRGWDLAGELQF